MSVAGTVLSNLDGLVFNKGYMKGTRDGGAADAITFGALQNVALSHEFGTVEISGPEALPPLGVGIGSETLTGSFDHGVIHPEQYLMMMGGDMNYVNPNTVYTKLVTDEPAAFDLHFESAASNEDLDVVLYNCLMPTWNLRGDNRGFMIGSGNFRVYGQSSAEGSKLFTLTKPGNLTNSS